MALPVWLPFAFQAGSMISSGIGNYLEGRNQERYQNRVFKMQQEAMRKREEAERRAGRASIFSGITGSQRVQPRYEAPPEIEPYESSGAASIFSGIGTALKYAGTAVNAYDTIRESLISGAEAAGMKEGASRLPEAISKSQPAITSRSVTAAALPGQEVMDPGVMTTFAPEKHYGDVLSNLVNAKPDSEGLFSGWFADARKEAYDRGFNTSLGALQKDYQSKLVNEISRAETLAFQEKQAKDLADYRDASISLQKQQHADAIAHQEKLAGLSREAAKKETVRKNLLALKSVKVQARQDPILVDLAKRHNALKIKFDSVITEQPDMFQWLSVDKNGLWRVKDGYTLTSTDYTNLEKIVARIGSDEALMESDFIRMDNLASSYLEDMELFFTNIKRRYLAGEKELVDWRQFQRPEQIEAMINSVQGAINAHETAIADRIPVVASFLAEEYSGESMMLLGMEPIHNEMLETELSNYLTTVYASKFNPDAVLKHTQSMGEAKILAASRLNLGEPGFSESYTVYRQAALADYKKIKAMDAEGAGRIGSKAADPKFDRATVKFLEDYGIPYTAFDDPEFDISTLAPVDRLPPGAGRGRIKRLNEKEYFDHVTTDRDFGGPYQGTNANPLYNLLPNAQGILDQNRANAAMQEAAVNAGLASYTNNMKESNYSLADQQAYIKQSQGQGLEGWYADPAMLNITPGVDLGSYPPGTGISRVGGPLGLSGLYSNLAPYTSKPSRTLLKDFGYKGYDPKFFEKSQYPSRFAQEERQYLSRAAEDWNRIRQGQTVGRYKGAGGRYAPVPSYLR
jgi:hypothetical protein